MFFWVFPRRHIVVFRRFGTCCQFHLQRLEVNYEVWVVSSHYPHFIIYFQPLKMELTTGSETSANHNMTPGKYPKEHIQEFIFINLCQMYSDFQCTCQQCTSFEERQMYLIWKGKNTII